MEKNLTKLKNPEQNFREGIMRIKYLGHASFLVEAKDGTRIMTDPYDETYGGLNYKAIEDWTDIVTISHEHGDHNKTNIPQNPEIIKGIGIKTTKNISFKGISSYHDETKGSERGPNTIFIFEMDGIKVCHLGDLGHSLPKESIDAIGKVDILFIPVGGFYTIDAKIATKVVDMINPKICIPMHYKTSACEFPISVVDNFLSGKTNVRTVGGSEINIEGLPESQEIWVLEPANG